MAEGEGPSPLHEPKVAAFLPDGGGETVPGNVEGIAYPIHALQIAAMEMACAVAASARAPPVPTSIPSAMSGVGLAIAVEAIYIAILARTHPHGRDACATHGQTLPPQIRALLGNVLCLLLQFDNQRPGFSRPDVFRAIGDAV